MNEHIIDRVILENAARAEIGQAFVGVSPDPSSLNKCAVGVAESLADSKWRGRWTETLRAAVRLAAKSAECVCVKPIPFGDVVWYRIAVA